MPLDRNTLARAALRRCPADRTLAGKCGMIEHVEFTEHRIDLCLVCVRAHHRQTIAQVFPRAEFVINTVFVAEESDLCAKFLGILRGRTTLPGHLAFFLKRQPAQRSQQGRLAGTVGARHMHEIARIGRESDAIEVCAFAHARGGCCRPGCRSYFRLCQFKKKHAGR